MKIKRTATIDGVEVDAEIISLPVKVVKVKYGECDYCYTHGGPIECWESEGKLWLGCHSVKTLLAQKEGSYLPSIKARPPVDAVITLCKGE